MSRYESDYQFKLFEDSSLAYVADQIGLWDHSVSRAGLEAMSGAEAQRVITGTSAPDDEDEEAVVSA